MRADEDTISLRETIANAGQSSVHHDTLFRENIFNSTRARGDILASVSTQLRHDTNVVKIKAKHALESHQRIIDELRKKKERLENVVQLRFKLSANMDSTLARILSLKDELAIYQKLEVYHSNRAHITGSSELPPLSRTGQDTKNSIDSQALALSPSVDDHDFAVCRS